MSIAGLRLSPLCLLIGEVGDHNPVQEQQQELDHEAVGVEQQGSQTPAPDQLGDDDRDEGVGIVACLWGDEIAHRAERVILDRIDHMERMSGVEPIPGVEQVLIAKLSHVEHRDIGRFGSSRAYSMARLGGSAGVGGEHDHPVARSGTGGSPTRRRRSATEM